MARLYKDYILVDKEFIPVFDKDWDKQYPDRWKSFYPHITFKEILGDLVSSLEMASNESRKSLWVSGAYGTGKTFASFALKHILEDSIDDVQGYFEKQDLPQTLFKRFSGIRNKGDILVVHRSSSSGITGDNLLFSAVQESIKQALKDRGYQYHGGKSLYDNILDILKDPNSYFNFKGSFNKHRGLFSEYATPEDVIKDLEDKGVNGAADLLQRIIEVMDKANFNPSRSPEDVRNWIKEIIEENNLYAIVFIWDEFSDYFRNNQAITGLQELAQASFTIPFYFLLITHLNYSQFIHDAEGRKRTEARFKPKNISMADTTAFMLMSKAISKVPDLRQEWDNLSQMLWEKVESMVKNTINQYATDVNNNELKSLLPLHPYAAFTLIAISSSISSNQRTMFQFLSGGMDQDEDNKHNFRWYIENHSVEDWYWLTSDYIWDYFFVSDNIDLDENTRSVISHYTTFENHCDSDDEKRVLKTVMLLSAMHQKSGSDRGRGASVLLRPTLKNITSAFFGTALTDRIRSILDKFVQKGIIGSMPERDDVLYVTQSKTIDQDRFEQLHAEIKNIAFEKVIDNEYISERFNLTGYLSSRFTIDGKPIYTTHRNLKAKLEGTKNWPLNTIPLIFVYAKNEEDVAKNRESIQKHLADFNRDIVIVDTSSQPFGEQQWNNFIELKTKSRYFLNIDSNLTKLNDSNAKGIIEDWKNKLDITTIQLYTKTEPEIQLKGAAAFRSKLKDINKSVFRFGIENITENDKIFASSGFKETVAVMGMDKAPISSNYSYLNGIKTNLIQSNLWNSHDYYCDNPSHHVSEMKIALEKIMTEGFNQSSQISIIDIWNKLQEKPFGLFSCTGSVFILGFLLKEYSDGKYYKKDIVNTVLLTHDGLADLIFCAVKGLPKAESLYIVKMTPEQQRFCEVTGEIFNVSIDRRNSIQDIQQEIKLYLPKVNFPLWSLNYYAENEGYFGFGEAFVSIVDLLCEFISPESINGRDETKIAEELSRLYKQNPGIDQCLRSALSPDNMKEGMKCYIASTKPELISIARRLNIGDSNYISELKLKLSGDSSWLWNKGDIDSKITEVYLDYTLINEVNKIISINVNALDDAANRIREKLGAIKMPYAFFKDSCPQIDALLKQLIVVYKSGSFREINKASLNLELQQNSDEFNAFINNNLYEVFKSKSEVELETRLLDDECRYLYNKMDSNVIALGVEQYLQNLRQVYSQYKKNQKLNSLLAIWKDISGTPSPAKWSVEQRIPILCLFEDEVNEARTTFEIINKSFATNENQIDMALTYLENSKKVQQINEQEKCDARFRKYISGDYEILIENLDEVKDLLVKKLGTNVFEWYLRKSEIDKIVREYCADKYKSNFYTNVFKKIDCLSPEKAKEYLKELIKEEPLVGIRIMQG